MIIIELCSVAVANAQIQQPACSAEDDNLDIIISCDLESFPHVLVTECQIFEEYFEECKNKMKI